MTNSKIMHNHRELHPRGIIIGLRTICQHFFNRIDLNIKIEKKIVETLYDGHFKSEETHTYFMMIIWTAEVKLS